MAEKMLGVNEIKQKLSVSESTVMDMIHFEGLPAKKVGGQWQISENDLRIWQDPELSTRKATADKKAVAKKKEAAKDQPDLAAKVTTKKKDK